MMSPSSSPQRRLVWVRVGKTDHPAFVVDDPPPSSTAADDNPSAASASTSTTTTRIRWSSTGGIEEVPTSSISWSLSPRSRRSRLSRSPNDKPDEPWGTSCSERKRRGGGGGSRLSLSKRRRLNRERARRREEEEAKAADDECLPESDSVETGFKGGGAHEGRALGDAGDGSGADGGGDVLSEVGREEDDRAGCANVDGRGNGDSAEGDEGATGGGGPDEVIVIHSDDFDHEDGEDMGLFGDGNDRGDDKGGDDIAAESCDGCGDGDDDGGSDDDGYISSSSSSSSSDHADGDDPDWRVENDSEDGDDDGEHDLERRKGENNAAKKRRRSPNAVISPSVRRTWSKKGPSSSDVSRTGGGIGGGRRPVAGLSPSPSEGSTTGEGRRRPRVATGTTPTSSPAAAAATIARSCDDLASTFAGATDVICLLDDDDDEEEEGGNGGGPDAAVERHPPPREMDVGRRSGSGSELDVSPHGVEADHHDSSFTAEKSAAAGTDTSDAAPSSRPTEGGVGAEPVGTTATIAPEESSTPSSSSTSRASCPPAPPKRNEGAAASATAVTPSPSNQTTTASSTSREATVRRSKPTRGECTPTDEASEGRSGYDDAPRTHRDGDGGGGDHSSPRKDSHAAAVFPPSRSPPFTDGPSLHTKKPEAAAAAEPTGSSAGEPLSVAAVTTTNHDDKDDNNTHPRGASFDAAGGGGASLGSAARSSAYLLHLAEMCHAVLGGDGRWDGLFRWEAGDDLGAAAALARFHVPPVVPIASASAPPSTSLDRGGGSGCGARDGDGGEGGVVAALTDPSKVDPSGGDVLRDEDRCGGDHEKNRTTEEEEEEELLARAMLLYSRMFVRKGPWFRADDLLRYYTRAWRGGGGDGKGGEEGQSSQEEEPRTRYGGTPSSSSSGGTGGTAGEPHRGESSPPDHSDGSPSSCPRTPTIPSSNDAGTNHPTMMESSNESEGSVPSKQRSDSSSGRPCRSDVGQTSEDAVAGSTSNGSPPTDDASSSQPRDASAKLIDGTIRCGSDISSEPLTPTTSRSLPPKKAAADGGEIRSAKGGEHSVSSNGRMEDVRCGAPSTSMAPPVAPPSPPVKEANGEEDPLEALLTDIDRLCSMGLVRTFRDETECAVIAGNDRYKDGGGGILLADERRTVLHRLGGGSKKRTSGGGGGGGSKQQGNPNRNQIVQQMRSQRSIVFSTKGKGASLSGATLLPVRRHVRDVVLRSLRAKHAQYCSSKQNPSQASPRVGVGTCNPSSIRDTKKNTSCQRLQSKQNLPPLCIRPREGPLRVLRRLSRLYLVAGAGPGRMRGGETGWLSVVERDISPQDGRKASLPSYISQILGSIASGWHSAQFPGLQHRLKIRRFEYISHYRESCQLSQRHLDNDDHFGREKWRCNADGKVFVGGISEFRTWEVAAEMRASMDRLMETNALCQLVVRRQKKKKESQDAHVSGDSGRKTSHGDGRQIGNDADGCGDEHPEDILDIEDAFDVLTVDGRHSLVRKLLEGCCSFSGDVVTRACRHVEEALREVIVECDDTSIDVGKADGVVVRRDRSRTEENNCDRFENSAERIICSLAVVATEVLMARIQSMRGEDLRRLIEQPWLRHLQTEAVLAYCVWDAVEILEKRRYYGLAVRMLATILGIHPNLAAVEQVDGRKDVHAPSRDDLIQRLVQALLARRNRGKAFERLVVDCAHLMRMTKKTKQKEGKCQKMWMGSISLLCGGQGQELDRVNMNDVQHVCANIISRVGQSGSVPFSFLRGFARRLKRPLAQTMVGMRNEEMSVLNIRLGNGEVDDERNFSCRRQNREESLSCNLGQDLKNMKPAYQESMQLATLPAALLPRDDTSSGSCAEQISSEEPSRSITVIDDSDDEESLFEDKVITGDNTRGTQHNASTCAIIQHKRMRRKKSKLNEKPNKARATEKKPKKAYRDWNPITDFSVANSMHSDEGGRCRFVGWEDEGGKSIINRSLNVEELALEEYHSGRLPKDNVRGLAGGGWIGWHDEGGHVRALFRILCSSFLLGCPRQSALGPKSIFLTPYQSAPLDLHVGHAHASCGTSVKSFYFRRKQQIDEFLEELEGLSDVNLCDLVHRRITENIDKSKDFTRDTLLTRDANELRTLSMIAAGFGGKMLATMFRCLLFDYRHYSGGMPDLLLARARYDDIEAHGAPELVDLGKWVGEAFDSDVASEGRIADLVKVLIERDDEFLGCTKSSESSASSAGLWKRDNRRPKHANNEGKRLELSVPEKLTLAHNGRRVKVECMFVEVKSANDRLDGRQEDWLNILDVVGNARVCKFGNGRSRASAGDRDDKKL